MSVIHAQLLVTKQLVTLYKTNRIFPLYIAPRHATLTTLQRGVCVISAESGKSQLISGTHISLLEHCDLADLSVYKYNEVLQLLVMCEGLLCNYCFVFGLKDLKVIVLWKLNA